MINEIVGEASVDWIDMGHAIGIVSLAEGGDDDLALLRRATSIVARLIREGRLVPGDVGPAPGVFVPWSSTPDESARRLEEYVNEVVAGTKPYQPWEPCMFAAAGGSAPS